MAVMEAVVLVDWERVVEGSQPEKMFVGLPVIDDRGEGRGVG